MGGKEVTQTASADTHVATSAQVATTPNGVHVDHDFWRLPSRPRRWSASSSGGTSSRTTASKSNITCLASRKDSNNIEAIQTTPVDRVLTLCDGQSAHKGITESGLVQDSTTTTNDDGHCRGSSGQRTDSSEPTTPSIIVTQPSLVVVPTKAATETSFTKDAKMSRRNRGSSGDSRHASLRLMLSPDDSGRVPFPLTVPTPTRSRHDSYSSLSLRQPPTPTPVSSRFAPARSSSLNYYEPPSMTEAGRSQFRSFHTDSTGQFIEIPRFKKRELNLAIVRGRAARVWWALLWTVCVSYGLVSLFFDVNVLYIILQVAMYPPYQPNGRQVWIFAGVGYALCWVISVLGVWLGCELCYQFWRCWNRRYPAIEPIYFSLAASTHLSLLSFDHFVFLLHTRLSPLGTSHASDIVPETAYALVQLLPGLLPLGVRAGIAGILLLSFWNREGLVPAGTSIAAVHRDSNFFNTNLVGELSDYSKGVLLAFVCWVAARIAVVLASAVLLWWYSFRPFARLRSWSPHVGSRALSPSSAHDPADWNTPAKSWRDENEFQWAWRERTRARIQNAFELCMVRPRHVSGKMLDLIEPATSGYQEVLRSPTTSHMRTPTSAMHTPSSVMHPTPNSYTHLMRNAPATTPTPDKVTFFSAMERNKDSHGRPRYPSSLSVGATNRNDQLSSSAMYREVIVEDTLYRLSEESECHTAATSEPRWPHSARSMGTVLSDGSEAQYRFERAEPGPLSASSLPSPDDPLPCTPRMSAGPTDERFKTGILTRVTEVDSLAEADLAFAARRTPEPVKDCLGLPPPRSAPPRSTRGRHESSNPSDAATFHTREASGASGLSGVSAMSASTASVSVSKFLNYNGTPPPIPPRPRIEEPSTEDCDQDRSQEEHDYKECDTRSHVSGHSNEDLITLQHFVERDTTTVTSQLMGSPEFIRFRAHSRRLDNSFEHGNDGYGYGQRDDGEHQWNRSPPAFPSSLIRISGSANATSNATSLLETPSAFPKLPPLPNGSASSRSSAGRTPASSMSSRAPQTSMSSRAAGSASSRATAGNLSSRVHSNTPSRAAVSSASSRGGAAGVNQSSASTASSRATRASRRGPRPPNIILPPNHLPWIDLATPNEFGQLTPPRISQQSRSNSPPSASPATRVGLGLIPPSESTVWASMPGQEGESMSRSRGRRITPTYIAPEAEPPTTLAKPNGLPPPPPPPPPPTDKPRRRRTRSVLGLEFEMIRADAHGHVVVIDDGSGSDSAVSREPSGVTVESASGRSITEAPETPPKTPPKVPPKVPIRTPELPTVSTVPTVSTLPAGPTVPPRSPRRPRRVPVPTAHTSTSPYVTQGGEGILDRLRRMSSA